MSEPRILQQKRGFSEGALFRRFPTKTALLDATFLYVLRKWKQYIYPVFMTSHYDDLIVSENPRKRWFNFLEYMTQHHEETLFYLRYRFSSYFTKDMRKRFSAYYGGISSDGSGGILEDHSDLYLLGMVDMTACSAEHVINGSVSDVVRFGEMTWESVKNILSDGLQTIRKTADLSEDMPTEQTVPESSDIRENSFRDIDSVNIDSSDYLQQMEAAARKADRYLREITILRDSLQKEHDRVSRKKREKTLA